MKKQKLIYVVVISLIIFISGVAAGVAGGHAINETISVVLARDISFELDGQPHEFKDPDGQVQHPIIYEGSSYLPVRSIAEATGVEVDWDDNTRTITLNRELADTPYKDAQDYETDLLKPSWADNKPDPAVVRQRINNDIDTYYEHIYLLEYLDLDDDQSYANYLVSEKIYDRESGFSIDFVVTSSTLAARNNTNRPIQIYKINEDGIIERTALTGSRPHNSKRIIFGTISRAELKDMEGNILWSND